MTDQEYLERVLEDQTLADDSQEVKDLHTQRDKVKKLLSAKFGTAPVLREGGSKAKGTMIRESYDLDLPYYFPRDDNSAGNTLKEIYESVEKELSTEYSVVRKGVAVRLQDLKKTLDFHIDVVPGRFVDGDDGDAFLYPATTDKERLQTNLEKHVKHVQVSGVVDAIRLMKLWRTRRGILLKTFALELLVVDILKGKGRGLPSQLERVLIEFRDKSDNLAVTDPANQSNDISGMLSSEVRSKLKNEAKSTLDTVGSDGWEGVFGELSDDASNEDFKSIVIGTPASKPWCENG